MSNRLGGFIAGQNINISIGTFTAVTSPTFTFGSTQGTPTVGQAVQFTTTGTLPTGLSTNTTYYVISTSTNTCQFSTTLGGSAVTFTNSSGSGTHTAVTQRAFSPYAGAPDTVEYLVVAGGGSGSGGPAGAYGGGGGGAGGLLTATGFAVVAGTALTVTVGAGATGVELAAELHRTTRQVISYGMDRVDPDKDMKVILIEAAPRILPALPDRVSAAAQTLLVDLGVEVIANAKVEEVFLDKLRLADGIEIPAELIVWAAGVKAPDFLHEIGGLESNRANQLVVLPTLQTTRDSHIFAMGDCAACPWPEANNGKGGIVPPRAQAAHQQASHLFAQIENIVHGKPLKAYRYRDFGSLVSLGKFSSVGSMMGGLIGGSLMIDGFFAKIMYLSLYKLHQLALHGWVKVILDTISRLIHRRTDSIVKLH